MDPKAHILIVEDEKMIAEDIVLRLVDMGYTISGCATSVDQAIAILEEQKTDLILIDINLEGKKDGFDLAFYINRYIRLPFIFLTSLANKSILEKAKEVHPCSYLLKPFNDRQMQFSIEIALSCYSAKMNEHELNQSDNCKDEILQLPNSLFLRKDFQFKRVDFNDIFWLEAESNYTMFYTRKGNFMYSTVLKSFEDKLPKKLFIRVHRSFIVNIENITGFEGNILFIGEKRIPVSKASREIIFNLFKVM